MKAFVTRKGQMLTVATCVWWTVMMMMMTQRRRCFDNCRNWWQASVERTQLLSTMPYVAEIHYFYLLTASVWRCVVVWVKVTCQLMVCCVCVWFVKSRRLHLKLGSAGQLTQQLVSQFEAMNAAGKHQSSVVNPSSLFNHICSSWVISLRATNYGPCSFVVSGPTSWNSLPQAFRDATPTLGQFQRRLKTSLFRLAYGRDLTA